VVTLLMSPLLRFIKFYFLRLGLLDGLPGLVHILIGCTASFAKYAKMLAFQRSSRMKVLLTGAAGFIGMHVCERLLARGDEVIGVDNLNDYYDVALKEARLARLTPNPRFRLSRLDIADRAGIAELFERERPQRVINLAAQAGVRYSLINPHAYVDSNVVGFVNILEGCRHAGVEHFVYASSSSIYGGNERMPFSEHDNVDHPVSLYAATKKSNELMAHTYSHLFNLPTTGLRFFTVYGPWGRPDMALFLFAKAISRTGRSMSSTTARCAATSPISTTSPKA
jgi:UDP-glucuronate 4-epimerase